jgi:Fe-S-cluster containining protein
MVPISRAEGFVLLELIDAMSEERKATLNDRFNRSMEALKKTGLLDVLEQAVANNDRKRLREIGISYFNLNLSCPFLEQQSCSIHPARPLSCREFLVVSDPIHCAKPDPETVENVVLPKRISPIVYKMCRQPEQKGMGFLPLTQLLDKADELRSDQQCEPAVDLVKRFLQNFG